jgi:hypothetical protein
LRFARNGLTWPVRAGQQTGFQGILDDWVFGHAAFSLHGHRTRGDLPI